MAGRQSFVVGRHGRLSVSGIIICGCGTVAELAASLKSAKYTELESCYLLHPIAVESLGPLNGSAVCFLSGLGQRSTNHKFPARIQKAVSFSSGCPC